MVLHQYVQKCGGLKNIKRLLATKDTLYLEVFSSDLVSLDKADTPFDTHLNQAIFAREAAHTDEILDGVCEQIDRAQKSKVLSYFNQVECEFRPGWHISPPVGLLNDPNGFIYHNGEYHLFYQWYPYGCEHKDKHWAHLTSTDLISWETKPLALAPSNWYDSHGVFSGHAVSLNNTLFLFYTGNVRIGEQRDRLTTQCLATSVDGINFEKHGPVVGSLPPGVTPHCRDPKVFKHHNAWVMLLGVQTEDLKGRVAIYKSADLYNWKFFKLVGDEYGDFGYMWECPDFFQIEGQNFTVIGPQGINALGEHHTIPHHNGISKVNIQDDATIEFGEFQHLDYGFDFYAPQTTLSPDGRRLMIGWMGLPDEVNHPSSDNGWVHQLTCIRELFYKDGHLLQQPVKEYFDQAGPVKNIILENSEFDPGNNQYILNTILSWGDELQLFKGSRHQLKITLDSASNTLILDRSESLIREGDTIRTVELKGSKVQLQILADTSSVEVFVNRGESVLSGRVFVDHDAHKIALRGKAQMEFRALNLI